MPSKYQPLATWLAELPAELDSAHLTFAEIEAIIGTPLPASAWTTTYWSSATMASVVRDQSFRARLSRHPRGVLFTRRSGGP